MESSDQHNIMTSDPPPPDRLPSEPSNHNVSDPSTPERIEPYTNRRGHTHKRTEEPPRDPNTNKMMCKHSECSTLRFERRCEWGKHMDKHDRPYKCKAKGCEKLQGFTYSGGLLRHQREVHKQNGGKSTALFCPEPNCKRNAGTGFTRKENLAEHIRRVHRRASASSEATSPAAKKDEEAHLDAESSMVDDEDTTTDAAEQRQPKRKRLMNHGGAEGSGADEELREQIKRLRQADEENKRRIASLEALVTELANR